MRFPDIYSQRSAPVISFELFPPKTEKAYENLRGVLPRLVALRPNFMTVTYGAMGSTRARTLEIVSMIRRDHGLDTAAHLTCVGSTRKEIDEVLGKVAAAGIENIVALRGDPPQGEERFVAVEGGFAHADELVAHIRRQHDFGIAVAGYPEKHVEAPDMDTDLRHLKHKTEAGADVVITQLFYQNSDYFAFVERTRALGIDVPVVPGLLPIQSYQQIRRITQMCGSVIPDALREQLQAAGDDAAGIRDIGVRWCVDQCQELLARAVPGIHFYVLNRAEQMERILSGL